jgi:hypothetical protein
MNVVHLDIVINTAYEKFSMKVYDIICEANPFSWLGLLKGSAKAVPRRFISAADKRSFEEASDELADIISAKIKSGGLDRAPNIKDAERYIDSGLLAAKKAEGAEGEAWIQDMIYTAVKKAHERSTADVVKVGADAAKVGPSAGSVFFTGVKTAINVLLAYEIFSNVDEVFNNPKNGYMPVMRYWENRLKSGAITQKDFEEAHRETLKIAVGRLAFQTPTLLLGGALAIFKVLNLLRTGALTLIGFKKVAAGLNALGQFASYGAKSVLAGYLAFLNSDIPIMNADINGDGKAESLRPLDAIKWLIVDDAFYVVGKTAGVAAGIAGPLEQALILAYEDLIEKYGVDINTGLSKVGAKPLPSAVPGSKKSLGTSTPPTAVPAAAPAVTPGATAKPNDKFNPADWVKISNGMYQHKINGTQLHPVEFDDLAAKSK